MIPHFIDSGTADSKIDNKYNEKYINGFHLSFTIHDFDKVLLLSVYLQLSKPIFFYHFIFKILVTQITCKNNNPKSVHAYYIYRKIHKKAKRQTLSNGFVPFEKTISHVFYGHDMCIFIADSTGFGFKISYTNLHRYWSILQAGFKAVMLPFQCMMPCLTL
jgi:hypothetical protein